MRRAQGEIGTKEIGTKANDAGRQGLWIGGMAAGGVIATHLLTFLVLAPNAQDRADLLADTGHASFAVVSAVAVGLLVAGATRFVARSINPTTSTSTTTTSTTTTRSSIIPTAARLAVIQSAAWVILESAERITHHSHRWELSAILLGLVVQALVALAGASALHAAAQGIDKVATAVRTWTRSDRRSRRQRGRTPQAPALLVARRRAARRFIQPAMATGAAGTRGPPYGS
ncbi:MAG: hypothetical protein QOK43_1140 [Acidimicrobiaceae bacterium]|nr:hypothetical protein [Acidimicrobiaceae bacterium]